MKTTSGINLAASLLTLVGLSLAFGAPQTTAQGQAKTIRGWLTDASCARGRANAGKYTGGNPECAKKCVAEGSRIVLALPDEKKLLSVANPEIAKSNVGNYVEITGTIDAKAETVEIKSLTMLKEGTAICALPRKKT